MATKMVRMGIKRKDLHPSEPTEPKSEKAYEKEEVRPELHLSGEHAIMMGAEDLKTGDRVRQCVEWVVRDHVKREVDGKPASYEMTLCIDKAGDQEEVEASKKDEDEGESSSDSPAMAYIMGNAKDSD